MINWPRRLVLYIYALWADSLKSSRACNGHVNRCTSIESCTSVENGRAPRPLRKPPPRIKWCGIVERYLQRVLQIRPCRCVSCDDRTGLGQSSLTGLGSELAQNPDSNAAPSSRSVWSFRQRSGRFAAGHGLPWCPFALWCLISVYKFSRCCCTSARSSSP
jgi:hypothetical protein